MEAVREREGEGRRGGGERGRERQGGEGERQTETDRHTHRGRDKETERERCKQNTRMDSKERQRNVETRVMFSLPIITVAVEMLHGPERETPREKDRRKSKAANRLTMGEINTVPATQT